MTNIIQSNHNLTNLIAQYGEDVVKSILQTMAEAPKKNKELFETEKKIYLNKLISNCSSHANYRSNRHSLNLWSTWLEDGQINPFEITPENVESYKDFLMTKYKRSSAINRMKSVKYMYEHLVTRDLLNKNIITVNIAEKKDKDSQQIKDEMYTPTNWEVEQLINQFTRPPKGRGSKLYNLKKRKHYQAVIKMMVYGGVRLNGVSTIEFTSQMKFKVYSKGRWYEGFLRQPVPEIHHYGNKPFEDINENSFMSMYNRMINELYLSGPYFNQKFGTHALRRFGVQELQRTSLLDLTDAEATNLCMKYLGHTTPEYTKKNYLFNGNDCGVNNYLRAVTR